MSFREQIAAKYGALNIIVEKVADSQATGRDVMLEIIASSTWLGFNDQSCSSGTPIRPQDRIDRGNTRQAALRRIE